MYFEQFTPGQIITTAERRATAEDLDRFLELSGLTNPIFMSDQGARAAGHRRRLVPAPWQLSLAMGLCQGAGFFDHVVAVLGFDQVRFHGPVHPGDRLRLAAEVLLCRQTRNPRRGLVELSYRLFKLEGQDAMTARATYLMRRRGG